MNYTKVYAFDSFYLIFYITLILLIELQKLFHRLLYQNYKCKFKNKLLRITKDYRHISIVFQHLQFCLQAILTVLKAKSKMKIIYTIPKYIWLFECVCIFTRASQSILFVSWKIQYIIVFSTSQWLGLIKTKWRCKRYKKSSYENKSVQYKHHL